MHIMVDLETLGLTPNAVVTQIGWAMFNMVPNDFEENGIIKSGCLYLNPAQQIARGRSVDWSTVKWWLGQSEEARNKMADCKYEDVDVALEAFGYIFMSQQMEGLWSNGPSFDQAILEDLHYNFERKTPWAYNAGRDYRTIKMLAPEVEAIKPTVAHDAEADAIAQAQTVQKVFEFIKNRTAA